MKIVKSHNSTKEDIKNGVNSLREKIEQRFGNNISNTSHAWSDDELSFSFEAQGFEINGIMAVSDSCISVDIVAELVQYLRHSFFEFIFPQLLGKCHQKLKLI